MTRSLQRLGPRRLAGAQDGASTAEFAIVFPLFFLLLFGILEFARLFWAVNTLQFVVSEGTRYVTISPTGKPTAGNCATSLVTYQSSVQAYLQRQLATYLSSGAPSVTASNCTASPATVTVNIAVSYNFNFMLSNLVTLLGAVPLQQQATVTTPLL